MSGISGPLSPGYHEGDAPKTQRKKSRVADVAQKRLEDTSRQESRKRVRESTPEETEGVLSDVESDAIEETLKKLAHLSRRRRISGADLPLIFTFENQLREVIALPNFEGKNRYIRLYEEKALPLLQKAKNFIRDNPMHFSVQAAAEKGKAAVAGQEVLKNIRNVKKLKPTVKSAHKVFLFPERGAVLKQMDAKAREETMLVNNLFNLMAKAAVVGAFEFKKAKVEAKPFVNMVLLGDLLKMPKAELRVFEKLSPESEFVGVLTGEIQLLDLHSSNLGMAPELSFDVSRFTDFELDGEAMSLNNLILAYLNDDVDSMSRIRYTEDGIQHESTLDELPQELKDALEATWKFVLFDTDLAIGESNSLQFLRVTGTKLHLIPLRSCLLETSWKDEPLSEATVARLLNSKERDSLVESWVEKKDAPIYRHLKPEALAYVERFVREKLEKYSRTKMNKQTIRQIQTRFVRDMTRPTDENEEFWQFIQDNSSLTGDLTSDMGGAILRQKRIAAQLFPRLTLMQQEALYSRQESRNAYLNSYQAFANSATQNDAKSLREIEQFIESNPSLFSTTRRNNLQAQLEGIKSFSEETSIGWLQSYWKGSRHDQLEALRTALIEETRPTYFNLMKAMYPLLADVYELALFAYGKERAGSVIGSLSYPIERVIHDVRAKAYASSHICQLALHVLEEMQKVKNPSLFIF